MRKTTMIPAVIAILGAILACNLPSTTPGQQNPDAILTAAALTVQAQLAANNTPTSAPAVNTPTFTAVPLSTFTPIPPSTLTPIASATATSGCDKGFFVTDVTYPDNTVVGSGTAFTKTWRLQNTGSCSWTPSYALVFVSGAMMSGPTVQAMSGNVNAGQTVDISVNLQAPSSNGTYTGTWGLRNSSGVIFTHFFVQIVVNSSGVFAVTHVTYTLSLWSLATFIHCPRVIAHITTNGAGTVTYHWIRSDGVSTSIFTLTYGSAGTQSINYDWALPHAGNGTTEWVGIYNDSPNNQSFGHLSFTTACTSP
jgi:hypothetical protein